MIAVFFSLIAGGMLLALFSRGEDRRFAQISAAALAGHTAFAYLQYWVQERFYGVSDIHTSAGIAEPISRAMEIDFRHFFPEVLKLGLHFEAKLPGVQFIHGDSNSTMIALTAITFFFVGSSLLPSYLVVSVVNWSSSMLFAKALAAEVNEDERPVAYVAAMLVPSVIFWSSAIVKEGFVMAGLGVLCYSARRSIILRELYFAPGMVVGALLIGLVKPYVLFPLVIAVAVWVFVARLNRRGGPPSVRLGPLILAALLAIGGLLIVGSLFPQFAVDKIGEQTAHQQGLWGAQDSSSSAVELGGSPSDRSLLGQVPFVPLALANTLFRPFVFEVRNVTMFAAAMESTLLTAVVAATLWRFRFSAVRQAVLRSPLLAASLVFVLIFGIAVGLTTLNLGSLSRYRLPMMPFYVLCVGILSRRLRLRSWDVPQDFLSDATAEASLESDPRNP